MIALAEAPGLRDGREVGKDLAAPVFVLLWQMSGVEPPLHCCAVVALQAPHGLVVQHWLAAWMCGSVDQMLSVEAYDFLHLVQPFSEVRQVAVVAAAVLPAVVA